MLLQNIENCIETNDHRAIAIAVENGKKIVFENKSKVNIKKIKCDGCIPFGSIEKRCDFIFDITTADTGKIVYFVELKGTDVRSAIKQLNRTISNVGHLYSDAVWQGRIVVSRVAVPNIKNEANYMKLKHTLKSQKGKLSYKTKFNNRNSIKYHDYEN
jgi:hypothetical protein